MSKLKTDAARRKFTAQGMKDLSQKSQLDIQAANQKERDDQLLEILKGTYGDLSNFEDILGKKGADKESPEIPKDPLPVRSKGFLEKLTERVKEFLENAE